jgi:hypothetical protein
VVLAWLVRRGIHVLAKSADEARTIENLTAVKLAESAEWPTDEDALLREADGSELVACVGGDDECARVFMEMAPPSAEQGEGSAYMKGEETAIEADVPP